MMIDGLHLISAAVFAAVVLLVIGIHRLYVDGTAGRRAAVRRLQSLSGRSVRRDTAESLRRKPRDRISLLAHVDRGLAWLDRLVREAGFSLPLRRVLLLMAGLIGLAFAAAMMAIGKNGPAGIAGAALAAIGIGVGGAIAALVHLRARRIARFAAQLPEALDGEKPAGRAPGQRGHGHGGAGNERAHGCRVRHCRRRDDLRVGIA